MMKGEGKNEELLGIWDFIQHFSFNAYLNKLIWMLKDIFDTGIYL